MFNAISNLSYYLIHNKYILLCLKLLRVHKIGILFRLDQLLFLLLTIIDNAIQVLLNEICSPFNIIFSLHI